MKKTFGVVTAAVLAAASIAGCSGNKAAETTAAETTAAASSAAETTAETTAEETTASSGELQKIVVGASPAPHAEILKAANDVLKEKGYELEIKEYVDYIQPNLALESGDLDANYFQHLPYLESFNKENGTNLVSAGAIHYEPFGVYAGKTTSLDELQDGATIAVPNDTTNEARALLLLEAQGLIKLKEDAGLTATKNDIVENPKNLQLYEVEAAQLPRVIGDVDVAVINGNYALAAGLKIADALASEDASGEAAQTYANIVAVRKADVDSAKTKALVAALTTQKVKDYINNTYNGAVVPIF